jgi:hypothetical protein
LNNSKILIYFQGPTFFAKLKNFFAKLIFFPPKLFLVFWKREIFLSKKKFGGKKINLTKMFFNLEKTIFPISKPKTILMKSQQGAFLSPKTNNPKPIFFEN